jgi:hypothetical protein
MYRMSPQVLVVLLLFNAVRLLLLVARGHIARDRLTFLAGFRAFQYYVFSRHDKNPLG